MRLAGFALLLAVWSLAAMLVAADTWFGHAFGATIIVIPAAWIGWRFARITSARC